MDIKWKLDFPIPDGKRKLKHGEKTVLLGSCFSQEMAFHFAENGFDVVSNPFGTIFHPIPLANNILDAFADDPSGRFFQRGDLHLSWDASGEIYGASEIVLREKIMLAGNRLRDALSEAKFLFITLGTAWGYFREEDETVVANCHKMPGSLFRKELTSLEKMGAIWKNALEKLRKVNPELEIIFTVSPVRHAKDGLIANNRSKSRLFELISALEDTQNISYFPSYEIVLDELRDYRFFASDGVHPNALATSYVWEKLTETYLDQETRRRCKELLALRALERHRVLQEGKEAERHRLEKEQKIRSFLEINPDVIW